MSALSLPAAKAHLNILVEDYDTELLAMIDAAEAILSNAVGPLTVLPARTDRILGGQRLVLPVAPVVSVTSITSPTSSDVVLADTTSNLAAGVIYYTNGATGFWASAYDVTYVPGRASVAGDLLLAIKEMVRHLWTSQQGGGSRPGTGGGDQQGLGYATPYRVQELIEPYRFITIGAA